MSLRTILAIPVLLALHLCLTACSYGPESPPVAVEGVIDLTEWEFRNGPVTLNGDYEFHWHHHVHPDSFDTPAVSSSAGFVEVPGTWNGLEIKNESIPGRGFATYRLQVLLPEPRHKLALKFLDMGTAFTAYLNGDSLLSMGRPATTASGTSPGYLPQIVDIDQYAPRMDLVFHVANFHHRMGGAWEPIVLGTEEQVRTRRQGELLLDIFLFGAILIMGLYHIGLFTLRRQSTGFLYFGLFCLLIALRGLVTEEIYLAELFPGLPWEWLVRIEYLTAYAATPLFALFLLNLFRKEFGTRTVRIILICGGVLAAGVFLLPVYALTLTVIPFEFYTVFSVLYGAFLLIRVARARYEGAAILLSGFIILCVAIANDLLEYNWIINTGEMLPAGLFLFIFSQAIYLAFWYSRAFNTVEEQRRELVRANRNYEHEISERLKTEAELKKSRQQLRNLSTHLESAREEERAWIAREIHDDLGQVLATLNMDVTWLQEKLGERYPELIEKTRAMSRLIKGTVERVRHISQKLRPSILDNLGFKAAVSWQVREFEKHSGIKCYFSDRTPELNLPSEYATALFRVFQEALTNISRHSGAGTVMVLLTEEEGKLRLLVKDDGKGISEHDTLNPSAFGLTGIRERMYLLNGDVQIDGVPGSGTTVTVTVPFPDDSDPSGPMPQHQSTAEREPHS